MTAFGKRALLPLAMTAAFAIPAAAQQQVPKECEINESKPSEISRAMLAVQMAASGTSPEAQQKQLKQAVSFAEKADPKSNPVARNFELGKALALWLNQPDQPTVVKRGALGFTTNADATIDLVAAVDSAFTAVETALPPQCTAQISAWRQQKAWVNLVNAAIEQVNNDKLDSAEATAKRSLVLFRGAPYGYMVLGKVAQKRNQNAEALKYFRQTVDASKDTTFADVRRQTLADIGNLATNAAEDAQGADKQNYLNTAKEAFQELAKDPGKQFADAAQQGLARIAQASGDTAAIKATYQDALANPNAFTYQQLMAKAVLAANSNQTADAIKLFDAAYKLNPYHRDVLANLAILNIRQDQFAPALEYVKRLVEVDPSNGENYRLYTFAYAGIQKRLMAANRDFGKKANATTNAAKKKALIDSAKVSGDSIKVVTDLALKYNMMADSLPVKVSFTEFTPSEDKATIGGTITNNSDASKTYTLKVDFLDKDGKVVTSQQTSVGPVTGKQSGRFSLTAAGKGIAAFRYAPVS
jgi:tetratricopeptide repeat protein